MPLGGKRGDVWTVEWTGGWWGRRDDPDEHHEHVRKFGRELWHADRAETLPGDNALA